MFFSYLFESNWTLPKFLKWYIYIYWRCSRWTKTEILKNIESETVACTFYKVRISRFAAHEIITINKDRKFEPRLFRSLYTLLDWKYIRMWTFLSQSSGLIANSCRTFQYAPYSIADGMVDGGILAILLALRTSFLQDLLCNP